MITPWTLTKAAKDPEKLEKLIKETESPNGLMDKIYYLTSFLPKDKDALIEHRHANGFAASWKLTQNEKESDERLNNRFENNHLSFEDLDEFSKIIRSFKKKHFQVILVQLPVSPSVHEIEKTKAGVDLTAWLGTRAEAVDVPNLPTYDGSHLSADSADQISHVIGERIKAIAQLQ